MTQELDKNGNPKLYCKNCGKRMTYSYTQRWFGTDGYIHHGYWDLQDQGQVYDNRQEAELQLQELLNSDDALGYQVRNEEPLHVEETHYGNPSKYYVEYSERVGEPVPYQFHSQGCMMSFLQRADIMAQIIPIIEANKAEPIIPEKKPRKQREKKIDLTDYDAMAIRIKEFTL